jgi:hypothetical protein
MNNQTRISLAILVFGGLAAGLYWYDFELSPNVVPPRSIEETVILPSHPPAIYQQIPEVQSYLNDLNTLIKNGQAVLPLNNNELDSGAQKAQKIVLTNADFLEDTTRNGQRMHNDMMSIRPAIISVLTAEQQSVCNQHDCYQAEKYNFVTNATTRAIVDIDDDIVLAVNHYPNMQADISLRLTRIAQQIALNAPEVKQQLDYTPAKKDMSMANVRAALKESPCENSAHLCVAPTFADHQKQQALWAIVDLTELKLAAAKWTGLGKTTTPACISERSLQNRAIMENYCQKNTVLEKHGWKFVYRLTGSDGLEIRDAFFQGNSVFRSAKTVDWHVSYQQRKGVVLDTTQETYMAGRRVEYDKDDDDNYFFGYNDAMGCPMFSTSVVLPFNAPQIRELYDSKKHEIGFYISQDFRNPKWPMACNYRYENRFEFYDDGSFRVVGINLGRGCGDNAVYRPLMRIDMAVAEQEVFYQYKQDQWTQWTQEQQGFQKYASNYHQDKYLYKITSKNNDSKGYYIEPNRGQFNDASRGDNATVFATLFKPEEGDQDLLTLGSCCNLKQEGVERYLSPPENIDGANIIIWYVPRIYNETTAGNEYCWADTTIAANGNLEITEWPCVVGPKFVPVLQGKSQ